MSQIAAQLDAGSRSAKQALLDNLHFFTGSALLEFVNEMNRYYNELLREAESTPELGLGPGGGEMHTSDVVWRMSLD